MTLTLSHPAKAEFEYKTHEYSPTYSSKFARFSPSINGGPVSSLQSGASSTMGTPHRGLPPPSAIGLPDSGRGPSHLPSLVSGPPPMSTSFASLPPAPSQWQGAEDGMKNWLLAKSEEDRRRQEEEKRGQEQEKRRQEEERTRQEELRLEQRKIEHSMLREAIQGGIPPHLVPIIFAGIGGGHLSNITAEWIQQYSTQLQTAAQQAHAQQQGYAPAQRSPGAVREARALNQAPPGAYGGAPQTPQAVLPPTSVLPGQPLPRQQQHTAFSTSAYAHMSPRSRIPVTARSGPELTQISTVPPPQIPTTQANVQPQPPQQEQSSPSIYFHHWVPPASQQEKPPGANPPATPSDYTSSPKKRKAQGGHAAQPPPTAAPQSHTSPAYSRASSSTSTPRRGHGRARSDASTRGQEGSGGSLSRIGTYSIQEHAEPGVGAQQPRPPEQRYAEPPREAAGHYQQPQYAQQQAPPLASSAFARDDRREGLPPMSVQTESRPSGAQHQLAGHGHRSVPASPRREVGGQ